MTRDEIMREALANLDKAAWLLNNVEQLFTETEERDYVLSYEQDLWIRDEALKAMRIIFHLSVELAAMAPIYSKGGGDVKTEWQQFLDKFFCRENPLTLNRPCDNGKYCDDCRTTDAQKLFQEWRNRNV